MSSHQMKNRLMEFLLSGLAATIIISFFGAFIYYGFIRDGLLREEHIDISNNAIAQYMANRTAENAKHALNAFAECYASSNDWVCRRSGELAFLEALVNTTHIDILFSPGTELTVASELKYALDVDKSLAMANYQGALPNVLRLKANALVRKGNIREAMPIYEMLFAQGKQLEVATSLRSLFKHFGCLEDVEIWGEFTAYDVTDEAQPPGAAYPEQPKIFSVEEVVDRRIRLRSGEFIPASPSCPVNRLLSFRREFTR